MYHSEVELVVFSIISPCDTPAYAFSLLWFLFVSRTPSKAVAAYHSSRFSTNQRVFTYRFTYISSFFQCVSLRHNVSDLSLESRLHGGGVSLVHTRRAPLEGIDLLDDEIKADIRARIRRELARPQYKKDLFFTGSVLQLGCGQANLDTATSGSPAVLPHSVPEKHCSFVASPTGPLVSVNTAVAQRVPGTRTSVQLVCQPNDSSVQELHNSQTNLSLATSVGAGGTSFIPPAPCPTVQPQTPSLPVGPMTTATTLLDSVDSYNPQPKAVNLIGPVPNGSPDMLSTNMCPFIGQDNQPATPDHDFQSVGPIHAGEEGDVDLEGRGDQDDLLVDMEDDVDLDGEDVDETGVGDDVDVDVEDDDVDEDEEFDATQSPRTCCYRCPFVCNFPDISCFSTTVDMLAPMRSFIHELLSPWILASPTFTFMLLSSTATMMGEFGTRFTVIF
ncbi:hypothetical protein EG68_11002 [Paragonimus skrjabini miyazakii]|uniref:Uncharacterized protein n=1 Tax=Paragonimus skrjabini miyazakii TaxID=59628 RepID=A0A8S9YHA2_9TREM|nr:hypothetical protein EG68_11002 [Paragonimus skrjabini miyazakii]